MRLAELLRRLRFAFFRKNSELELDEELRFHRSMEEEQRRGRGESDEDARRNAALAVGSLTAAKEATRDAWSFEVFRGILRELMQTSRVLRKRPLLSVSVVLTLALSIGAVTSVLYIVEHIALRPLPYVASGELYVVERMRVEADENSKPEGAPSRLYPRRDLYAQWREDAVLRDRLAGYDPWMTTVGKLLDGADTTFPERVYSAQVSENFFPLLGVSPVRGAGFRAKSDADEPRQVILDYRYWMKRFGGEEVVGKTLLLDDLPHVIAGVLPADYRSYFSPLRDDLALYVPLRTVRGAEDNVWRGTMHVVGRFGESFPPALAQQILERHAHAFAETESLNGAEYGVKVLAAQQELGLDTRPLLTIMLAVAGSLLLIACANLANLFLAQTMARSPELGMRAALGAGHSRLIRLVVLETALLAVPGAALALLFSWASVRWIAANYPGGLPRIESTASPLEFCLLVVAVTVLTTVIVSAVPAWWLRKSGLAQGWRDVGRGVTGSSRRLTGTLVACQAGLVVAVLVSSLLLLRSLWELRSLDLGFQQDAILTAQVSLPLNRYADERLQASFARSFVQKIEALQQVRRAAVTNTIPLVFNSLLAVDIAIPSRPDLEKQRVGMRTVSAGYFETLGTHARAGELLVEERPGNEERVVVNESFVTKFLPGTTGVDETLRFGERVLRISGVVSDQRNMRLQRPPTPEVYRSFDNMPSPLIDVAIRCEGDPMSLAPQIRAELAKVDAGLALGQISTMQRNVDGGVAKPRFDATLVTALTIVGALLAGVGIFGAAAYAVQARRMEFAVCKAVGASPADIFRQVMLRGLLMPLVGIVAGVPLAYLFAKTLESQLFGVTATASTVYGGAVLFVLATAVAAVFWPALRASQVQPIAELRNNG